MFLELFFSNGQALYLGKQPTFFTSEGADLEKEVLPFCFGGLSENGKFRDDQLELSRVRGEAPFMEVQGVWKAASSSSTTPSWSSSSSLWWL
eukprot:evm.model.NODE_6405_length_11551_cov_21.306726.2